MAKRRKDEPELEYEEPATAESEYGGPAVEDDQQVEAEAVEEGVAPTTGGPQKYHVERSGGTVRGKALEEGQVVVLTPEEALKQAERGVQLSWIDPATEPEIDNELPPEEDAKASRRM